MTPQYLPRNEEERRREITYKIEIKMNKEIRDYAETIFFGLSLRQFLFSALGCLLSVGIFFLFRDRLGTEAITWACIIFSLFASAPPSINMSVSVVTMVWLYIAELVFNMLVLVGTIKMADHVVKEMLGL